MPPTTDGKPLNTCLYTFNIATFFPTYLFQGIRKLKRLFEKEMFKKLFNFETIFFPLNSEETQTIFFLCFFNQKSRI